MIVGDLSLRVLLMCNPFIVKKIFVVAWKARWGTLHQNTEQRKKETKLTRCLKIIQNIQTGEQAPVEPSIKGKVFGAIKDGI